MRRVGAEVTEVKSSLVPTLSKLTSADEVVIFEMLKQRKRGAFRAVPRSLLSASHSVRRWQRGNAMVMGT
jgi:hypothetical protein